MCVTLGRKANLDWSKNRWKEEHDKLSRLMTLKSLSAESVDYKLEEFRKHLPIIWSGYLIPNSRRLGMEGLRQCHCVASYDKGIQLHRFAIAVVFINKQRWTVQLKLTKNDDIPLRIMQITTRFNKVPSTEEKELILAELNLQSESLIVPVNASNHRDPKEIIDESRNTFRASLPELQILGVARIEISFNGSGDSGYLDTPVYYDNEGKTIKEQSIRTSLLKVFPDFDEGDILYDAAEKYIDAHDIDWYNDAGGWGRIVIDVANWTMESDIYVRFEESSCEHSEEFSLMDMEEI